MSISYCIMLEKRGKDDILDRIPDNPTHILTEFLNITSHPESTAGKEIMGLKNLFPRPEISGGR